MTSWSAKRIAVLWVLGILGTVGLLTMVDRLSPRSWRDYRELASAGTKGPATVERTDRSHHCDVTYYFRVDARDYVGRDSDCEVEVGATVIITYLLRDPAINCLCKPERKAGEAIGFILYGGVLFPSVMVLNWSLRRRAPKAAAAQQRVGTDDRTAAADRQ